MNFKSVILSSIFISSILFSCATNKIESSSEFINDDSKDITYETFTEKNDYMEISIQYPTLKKFPELNDKITTYLNSKYKTYKSEFEEYRKDLLEFESENPHPSFNFCYEETFEFSENETYFSVTLGEYDYTGGAHGSFMFKTFTINKETKKEVSLPEMTGLSYEQISEFCRKELIRTLITESKEDLKLQDIEWLTENITYGTVPQPEYFQAYSVSGNKVQVIFNQYQVAPYVYGYQIVELPLK